jgi:predicted nucleotide-binding protein
MTRLLETHGVISNVSVIRASHRWKHRISFEANASQVAACTDLAEAQSQEDYESKTDVIKPRVPRVFIGHGHSDDWKQLAAFLENELHLEYDEFNAVPVAGVATQQRLEEMLNNASFAFLVATGENANANGDVQARDNVIHEIGLFQGRLGFRRAIVVLEEGCAEFSNIRGLGQLRYKSGQIREIFKDIPPLLEREGMALGPT